MSDSLAPPIEPAEDVVLASDEAAAPPAVAEAPAAPPAVESAPVESIHATKHTKHSKHTKHRLHKLAAHFGVPHDGLETDEEVDATAKKLGEMTGHAHLDPETLVHTLADTTGH